MKTIFNLAFFAHQALADANFGWPGQELGSGIDALRLNHHRIPQEHNIPTLGPDNRDGYTPHPDFKLEMMRKRKGETVPADAHVKLQIRIILASQYSEITDWEGNSVNDDKWQINSFKSVYYYPYHFQSLQHQTFPALDYGISQMKKWEMARMFVPAEMAFGSYDGIIRIGADLSMDSLQHCSNHPMWNEVFKNRDEYVPNSDLVMEVRVVDWQMEEYKDVIDPNQVYTNVVARGFKIEHVNPRPKGETYPHFGGTKGSLMSVHYAGRLQSTGKEFDSSAGRDAPFEFVLGAGKVIPGWEEAFKVLRKGEKALLTIPPEMGYGDDGDGTGVIPGGAWLEFDVELVDF